MQVLAQPSASSANLLNNDLLGDWPCDANIHRNSSAPSLDKNGKKFDPFADFMANDLNPSQSTSTKSASNSGRSTPGNVQRFVPQTTSQQQQDKRNFESFFSSGSSGPSTGVGSRFNESAFDDILSSQGFSSTAKNAQRSLQSIKREEEVKIVDPITLKVISTFKALNTIAFRFATGLKAKNKTSVHC